MQEGLGWFGWYFITTELFNTTVEIRLVFIGQANKRVDFELFTNASQVTMLIEKLLLFVRLDIDLHELRYVGYFDWKIFCSHYLLVLFDLQII
jgi:hypothetical protein